mmetsp:Transcript_5340/g.17275  ORF Transcript_5340/g.17275 Transcript_5340/m.17275 type:complete len:212 (+) Transcript_5340:4563-5198(+)
MSSDLEKASVSFLNGAVPAMWAAKCYPTLKPLASFFDDFMRRLAFLQTWITEGTPKVFWISGFYFTQSFLTGTMQNYARKHKRAIDTLVWSFAVMREEAGSLGRPEDGSYVDGLFLDGAAWDLGSNLMCDQAPKVLFVPMPVLWLRPCPTEEARTAATDYLCPVYKTSARRGTLSTTGHSTNFVLDILLPTPRKASYWILRGVAALTQLDF